MNLHYKIKQRMKCFCFLILMISAWKVLANSADTRPYELDQANKKLNAIYKKIFDNLKSSDQIKLKKAQREWIHFRDLDCAWAFDAEPLDCMIDRTENRAKELENTDFFDKAGNYSSIG